MKITSVAVSTPSLRVTNDDLVSQVLEHNSHLPSEAVQRYALRLRAMLERTGAKTRRFRDRARGETALDLTLQAIRSALEQSGAKAESIDLLIYCGVARGFLEPATAQLLSRSLGMTCDCFDLLDACMGWVRSLHVAYNFLKCNTYSRILVVNGEFNIYEHGYPALLEIDSPDKLRHTFPAFTIGEGATATLLTPSSNRWQFRFRSDSSKAGLCTIPLPGHAEYSDGDDLAPNGTGHFASLGMELSNSAVREMVRFVRDVYPHPECIDIWFPHAASAEYCRLVARRLGITAPVVWDGFENYGNLVSASIPTALWIAAGDNRLRRGQRMAFAPASAGMVLGLVDAIY